MATTNDILELINRIAPLDLSEEWDNSGFQVGNLNQEIKKVMIGLDVTLSLMTAAKNWNCDLVITHHPLLIKPEKRFDFAKMPGAAIEMAARHGISILSAHTNLDKAEGGLNDYFADKIGLTKIRVMVPERSMDEKAAAKTGIGRIGVLDQPVSVKDLHACIKEKLDIPYARVSGNTSGMVRSVAVCTGSGGSLMEAFLNSGADLYVTGDIKYHEARLVEEASRSLIDVGHFGSEHMAIDLLYDKLSQSFRQEGLDIKIKRFLNEKDPFTIVIEG